MKKYEKDKQEKAETIDLSEIDQKAADEKYDKLIKQQL